MAGASVLDVGRNGGFYSFEMKQRGAARVLGVDHDSEYLAQASVAAVAAQQEMAAAIERQDALGRERAIGTWLALRGIMRAVEGRLDEWSVPERAMLERIDWRREQFRFPGIDAFAGPTVEPGCRA